MTTALKRTGAALLTLLMFCVLTLGASAAANGSVSGGRSAQGEHTEQQQRQQGSAGTF